MIRKIVKGLHMELTPAIDEAVDKVVVTLDKHVAADDTSALVQVELGRHSNHHRTGDVFRAEINFHSRHGNLRAEAETSDLYAALAMAKDEILGSLRANKSKRIDFVRRHAVRFKNMIKGLPWTGKI
jgi:ribosomal subunit interface protein